MADACGFIAEGDGVMVGMAAGSSLGVGGGAVSLLTKTVAVPVWADVQDRSVLPTIMQRSRHTVRIIVARARSCDDLGSDSNTHLNHWGYGGAMVASAARGVKLAH